MGTLKDKIKGKINSGTGKLKQVVGRATDNPKLGARGVMQEFKGEAQKTMGKTKESLGNAVHGIGAKIKRS